MRWPGLPQQNMTGQVAQTTDIYFLEDLEARSPQSWCQQIWSLVRALSMACTWPPSHCALTWPFLHGRVGWGMGQKGEGESTLSDVSSYKDTNTIRAETLMTSFNLKFLETPSPNTTTQGLGYQHMKGWGWGGCSAMPVMQYFNQILTLYKSQHTYIITVSFKPDEKFTYLTKDEFQRFYVKDSLAPASSMEHSHLPIITKLFHCHPLKSIFSML